MENPNLQADNSGQATDREFENTIRPSSIDDFSGQKELIENLTIFIKTKGWCVSSGRKSHSFAFKNNSISDAYIRPSGYKLKIKLENNLFDKIKTKVTNTTKYHNVFILCCTKSGNYFVHTSLINSSTPKKTVIKKIDYKYYLQ
jgi:hypothetical protein